MTTTHATQRQRILRRAGIVSVLLFLIVVLGVWIWQASLTPRHDRTWEFGQEHTPRMHIDGDTLTVEHFRDFVWTDATAARAQWRTATFDLAAITGVDVVISHFADHEGVAHAFLAFRFDGGEDLIVSVEARRETHETYNLWKGLWRQFEMLYVVASERDLVDVRVAERDERVYVYPTVATPAQARQMLALIADDVNAIADAPQFYHTLWHNCVTVLTARAEEVADIDFPFSYKMLLPGYLDEVLYDMRVIPHNAPFDDIKRHYRVHSDAS